MDRGGKLCLSLFFVFALAHAGEFHAGFGRADITPTLVDRWVDVDRNSKFEPKKGDRFIDVNGNGKFDAFWIAGFHNGRAANKIHDPIFSLATVLDDGNKRIAIAVIDAIGFFYNDVQDVRKRISKAWKIDHVVICSTHNHEVPDLMGMWGPDHVHTGVNSAYLEQVKRGILKSIEMAVSDLKPAKMEIGEFKMTPQEGFLRDSRLPEVFDPDLRVMRFLDPNSGSALGSIVTWANHPETVWSENVDITADFVGYIRDGLEKGVTYGYRTFAKGLGGTHLYINGAIGGLMTTDRKVTVHDPFLKRDFATPSHEKARAQGNVIAKRILDEWKSGTWIENPDPSIRLAVNTFTLPTGNWKFMAAATLKVLRRAFKPIFKIETEINSLRIGDAHILTIPGEIYPELVNGGVTNPKGADYKVDNSSFVPIRQLMSGKVNFIFGLGNDELGYIIPKGEWDSKKPYSDKRSRTGEGNSVGPETAPIIYQQIQKVLSSRPPFQTTSKYELIRKEFASSGIQEKPLIVDFYQSTATSPDFKGEKRPLILVGEILGGNDEVTRLFAPVFARAGFHVLVVHTPKVNKTVRKIDSYAKLPLLKELIVTTLELYRSGLDWALEQPEVDTRNVGVFGISLGGMMTSYLMATDPRIKAGFFCLSGANPSGILAYSTEKGIRELRERIWKNERPGQPMNQALHREFEEKLAALNIPDLAKLPTPPDRRLKDGAKLIYAMFDQVVPYRYSKLQWEKMKRPEADMLPFVGHYQSVVYVPWVQAEAKRWFREKLLRFERASPLMTSVGG
jgi:hypothetical protein